MQVYYDIYKNPKRKDDESAPKSHVRVISNRIISEKTFNDEISTAASLTAGDIKGAISALRNTLVTHLSNGEKVKIDGIGTFSLSIECPDDFKDDGTYFPSRQIQVRTIKFRPEHDLVSEVNAKATFQHYRNRLHSSAHTEKEELQILKETFAEGGSKTLKELSAALEYNRAKADRRIKQLMEKGYLLCVGPRNIYSYEATEKLHSAE